MDTLKLDQLEHQKSYYHIDLQCEVKAKFNGQWYGSYFHEHQYELKLIKLFDDDLIAEKHQEEIPVFELSEVFRTYRY